MLILLSVKSCGCLGITTSSQPCLSLLPQALAAEGLQVSLALPATSAHNTCVGETRVLDGHAFVVEAAVSVGGRDIKPGINIYRFANRIPLLFEVSGLLHHVQSRPGVALHCQGAADNQQLPAALPTTQSWPESSKQHRALLCAPGPPSPA